MNLKGLSKKKEDPLTKKWQQYLSAKEDAAWKDWVDTFKPSYRALVDLLSDPTIGMAFKARALVVLFAPSEDDVPIYWRRDDQNRSTGLSMLSISDINLKESVPAELITSGFVSDLVIRACQNVPSDRSGRHMLFACNAYILQLLALLSVEQAQGVWPFFHINDPATYWNMETCSGYNPWYALMRNPSIPEYWKILSDRRMREIIDAEIAGHKKPREEHEDALRCYTSHLDLMWRYNKGEGDYSTDLLASQLKYLFSQDSTHLAKALVYREGFLRILPRLAGDQHQALRTQMIRFSFIGSEQPFRIYDEDDLRLAEQLQTCLDPADEMEHRALQELITVGRSKVEADKREQQQEEDRHSAILRRMQG